MRLVARLILGLLGAAMTLFLFLVGLTIGMMLLGAISEGILGIFDRTGSTRGERRGQALVAMLAMIPAVAACYFWIRFCSWFDRRFLSEAPIASRTVARTMGVAGVRTGSGVGPRARALPAPRGGPSRAAMAALVAILGLLAFSMYLGAGDLQTFHHEATAEKDGTIQHVIEAPGPQGATFTPFVLLKGLGGPPPGGRLSAPHPHPAPHPPKGRPARQAGCTSALNTTPDRSLYKVGQSVKVVYIPNFSRFHDHHFAIDDDVLRKRIQAEEASRAKTRWGIVAAWAVLTLLVFLPGRVG